MVRFKREYVDNANWNLGLQSSKVVNRKIGAFGLTKLSATPRRRHVCVIYILPDLNVILPILKILRARNKSHFMNKCNIMANVCWFFGLHFLAYACFY